MRTGIWLTILTVLLQGCATRLDIGATMTDAHAESAAARPILQFQQFSIEPEAGAMIAPEDLQPGDILLTAVPTLASAGIRLITFAPVSHAAVYIGNHEVAEAVRTGVRVRSIENMLAEETVVLAFRHPDLSASQAWRIRAYVLEQIGVNFNYLGAALHAPFSLNRRLCELPLMPSAVRDACIRSIGAVYHLATSEGQFFCSQLVLQAYRHAGVAITDADPRLITPADILHMREGDVPSVRVHTHLRPVGHLKNETSTSSIVYMGSVPIYSRQPPLRRTD